MDLSEAKSRVFSAARPAIYHKLNTYAKHVHVEVRNAKCIERWSSRGISILVVDRKESKLSGQKFDSSFFFFLSFFLEEI